MRICSEGLEREIGVHRLRRRSPPAQQKWCTSRASPVSTTRPVCMRRPRRIRWWCTAAVASSAGIGTRSAGRARSGQDQDVAVRQHARPSPRSRCGPALPRGRPRSSGAGQVVSMVAVRNAPSSSSSIERIFSRSALVRTGCDDFQPLVRAGMTAEQVRARADHRDQRHHQLLADRIDRRVGDLREVLLEIVVEQLGLLREHGNRRVGAHRADRIVAARWLIGSRKNCMSSCV